MTDPTPATPDPTPDPKDVCECGDFRDDHRDGKGACRFGDAHPTATKGRGGYCSRFVLSRRAARASDGGR